MRWRSWGPITSNTTPTHFHGGQTTAEKEGGGVVISEAKVYHPITASRPFTLEVLPPSLHLFGVLTMRARLKAPSRVLILGVK